MVLYMGQIKILIKEKVREKMLERKNIYNAFLQKTTAFEEVNGEKKIIITEQAVFTNKFKQIESLIQRIINSKNDFFTVTKIRNNDFDARIQASNPGRELMDFLCIYIEEFLLFFPQHQFNPYVQIFEKYNKNEEVVLWEHRGEYFEYKKALETAKKLNDFVGLIRKELIETSFKKKVNNFERLPRKNYQSLTTYFDDLFEINSKLLILRVDLGYQKINDDIKKSKSDDVYNKIQQHRTDFLGSLGKHLSKQLSENILVGYVWRLNYSLSQSWHYHMVICLNGQSVRESLEISKHIDEHWHSVTKGQGVYHSYNPQQSKFRSSGVGLIDRQDVTLRNELKQAALYMTMTDYYSKLITPDKGRTLGRGTIPKKQNLSDSKAHI